MIPGRVSVAKMRKTCPVDAFRRSPRFPRANASPLSAKCSARRSGPGCDTIRAMEIVRATEPEDSGLAPKSRGCSASPP